VLVEAILVEMSADKAVDLGVNWLILDRDADGNQLPAGGFVSPVDGTGIGQILQGVLNPDGVTSLPSGLTLGLGTRRTHGAVGLGTGLFQTLLELGQQLHPGAAQLIALVVLLHDLLEPLGVDPHKRLEPAERAVRGEWIENGKISEAQQRKGLKPETKFRPD
jgi:hypothetical protein